jgi:1-acyl-sn-glycerol-3-phosphate acyltransferase
VLAPVLGVRIDAGGPAIPPGPCLVCPNHVSYLDILVLAWTADAVFVSRGDVAGWPGIGPLSKLGGTVFIDRSRKRDAARAAETIGAWLDRGFRVVVFLEGRNGTGGDVLTFRSSLLEPACARGVPCVPVAIRYTLPADTGATVARSVAWVDDTPFAKHAFRLAALPRIDVTVRAGAPRSGADRKALAAALEGDVRALLGPGAATRPSGPSPGR